MKATEHSDRLLSAHMLDCIARIREYTADGRSTFLASSLIQDAVIRNLRTMSESSQRPSKVSKASEPDIPWTRISGMRNILVHQYLGGIDLETVWTVVEGELEPLQRALERMLAQSDISRSP